MTYVPIDEVNPYDFNSEGSEVEVNKFHLKLFSNTITFTKSNQEKEVLLSNIGWEKLTFNALKHAGSGFTIVESLPDILLPGETYSFTITQTITSGSMTGGIFVDVGDSYGNKYIELTGSIT